MNKKIFDEFRKELKKAFPDASFEIKQDKLVIKGVPLPVIPEEVSQIVNKAGRRFNLRKGQVAWKQNDTSIEIYLTS